MANRVLIFLLFIHSLNGHIVKLSCQQIRQFVDGHNLRRQSVAMGGIAGQPPASKMNYLVWDEELAEKAAKWADHGVFSHNSDRTVLSGRWPIVGENIYYSSTFSPFGPVIPNIEEAMNTWFFEWSNYNFEPYSLVIGPKVGHYTQMVWADTTKVGCGIAQKRENEYLTSYFVCNYGPTGNWIDQTPYERQAFVGHLQCPEGDCKKPYGRHC